MEAASSNAMPGLAKRRGLGLLIAIAFLAACVGGAGPACAAEPPAEPGHPIWTLVPTHIDRAAEHLERLAPETKAEDRLIVSLGKPIRLGPDGTFVAGGHPARIFGLTLPDRQRICEAPDGARWACGLRAYAAFAALLASTALSCERVGPAGASVLVLTCKAGAQDIAERMIGDGWAEPGQGAGAELQSLRLTAEVEHRGLWRITAP